MIPITLWEHKSCWWIIFPRSIVSSPPSCNKEDNKNNNRILRPKIWPTLLINKIIGNQNKLGGLWVMMLDHGAKEEGEEEISIMGNNAPTATRWTTLWMNSTLNMVIHHGTRRITTTIRKKEGTVTKTPPTFARVILPLQKHNSPNRQALMLPSIPLLQNIYKSYLKW